MARQRGTGPTYPHFALHAPQAQFSTLQHSQPLCFGEHRSIQQPERTPAAGSVRTPLRLNVLLGRYVRTFTGCLEFGEDRHSRIPAPIQHTYQIHLYAAATTRR